MKKLILFDVDGTLINKSEDDIDYFSYGIKQIYNIDASTKSISCHGMNDQQIIIEILKKVD
jgi:phosphoserine phosphatase